VLLAQNVGVWETRLGGVDKAWEGGSRKSGKLWQGKLLSSIWEIQLVVRKGKGSKKAEPTIPYSTRRERKKEETYIEAGGRGINKPLCTREGKEGEQQASKV